MSDRFGGARALVVFAGMMLGTLGVMYFLTSEHAPGAFTGFFTNFSALLCEWRWQRINLPNDTGHHAERDCAAFSGVHLPPSGWKQAKRIRRHYGLYVSNRRYGAFFIPKSFGMSARSFR
ncbi:MAG: hypothetical protein IPL62_20080 [Caulobacteraceae bacterium]|nr:hypothetical protein [Caulobacteraceae bacterium]